MRKTKRFLSAILAMALLFSTVSIGVQAAYSPYKDDAITSYDSIDKPVLTTDQYGSMILDYLDKKLAEKHQIVEYDLEGIISIRLDLSSIDSALDDLVTTWGLIEGAKAIIGGDIVKLDFSAIQSAPRRDTAGKTDLDIVYALLQFLADNSPIFGKIADGTLDLGIVSSLVDLSDDLDIGRLIKRELADTLYDDRDLYPDDWDPDTPGEQTYRDMSVDWYIVQIFYFFLDKWGITSKLPQSVLDIIDINNISIYDFIEQIIKAGLNSVVVPALNKSIKIIIREACGVDYSAIPKESRRQDNGDTSNLNEAAKYIDINYTIPQYDFSTWKTTDTCLDHVNDFIGWVLTNIDNEAEGFVISWNYDDGNAGLFHNIANLARDILPRTGQAFFSEYITVPTAEEYAAMTDEQLVCFIVSSILNGHTEGLYLENGMYDSIPEMLFNFVKNYAADKVPGIDYGDFEDYDDPMYAVVDVAIDLLVVSLNRRTNANLSYGQGFDATLNDLSQWAVNTYGGIFDLTADGSDAFELLDEILFTIIPSNWLGERDSDGDGVKDTPRDSLYDILFTDILDNIANLDLAGIIDIFSINENVTGNNESELSHSLTYVVIQRVSQIINFVIPGVFSDTYEDFEDLLTGDVDNSGIVGEKLKNVIVNLFTGLRANAPRILAAALPIACHNMDLSTEQQFEYPYISLGETISTTTSSFYISNESYGLNTYASHADGINFEKDALYKYDILNVTTNQSGVTVSPTSATINGGDSVTFTLNGARTAESVLAVAITYNVLDEQGNTMTASPLVNYVYSYVSDVDDDSETDVIVDVDTSNRHSIHYKKAEFINQDDNLSKLSDFKVEMRKAYNDSDGTIDSAVTNRVVTINSALSSIGLVASGTDYNSIGFGRKTGLESDRPFAVNNDLLTYTEDVTNEDGSTTTVTRYRRPASGVYPNSVAYTFSPTSEGGNSETINFTQYVVFYNDYSLPSLLENAINANRQQFNYSTGTKTVEKQFYDEGLDEYYTETVELNGADCWNAYQTAVANAVAIVYRPKTTSAINDSVYESCANALSEAIADLENFELEYGIATVENALYAIDPLTPQVLVSEATATTPAVYRSAYYYESGYPFVDAVDYEGYTYERFYEVANDARKMISKTAEGANYGALEIAYTANKVALYGSRLIRVKACADRLEEAFTLAQPVYTAGNIGYTASTWEAFVNAYNFAVAVRNEAISNPGTVYPNTNHLNNDGIRQSKINTARVELNEARKRLIIGNDADLTALRSELDTYSTAIYNAGNANNATYTAESWASFVTAYDAAVAALTAGYTSANQATVDTITSNLIAARTNLAAVSTAPEIVFVPLDYNGDGSEVYQLTVSEGTWSDETGDDVYYVYGACCYDPWIADYGMIDGLIYDYEATDEGYEIVIAAKNDDGMSYGTGAMIELRNNGVAEISAEFVIFGDINGDASIDSVDLSTLNNVIKGAANYSWLGSGWFMDTPQMFACDLNDDWNIDSVDASVMRNYTGGVLSSIDQSARVFA